MSSINPGGVVEPVDVSIHDSNGLGLTSTTLGSSIALDVFSVGRSGSGTIVATNGTVTASVSGLSTVNFNITGTWVGILAIQGTVDGTNWFLLVGQQPGSTASLLFLANTALTVNCSGLSQVRIIDLAHTSGTVEVAWFVGIGNSAIQVHNLIAANLQATTVGNVASAAADSGNPVKVGGIVNLNGTLFTNAQRANNQMDVAGSIYVNHSGRIPSYSAFSSFTAVASATDVFTVTGSATKTVKIRSVRVSGTNTGNTNALVLIVKRSTANTGGTSSNLTEVPHDSTSAAATATALSYTANPTTGSLVGNICGGLLFLPLLASSNIGMSHEFIFGIDGYQPIVLRGTSEVFAVNLNGVALGGTTVLNIRVTWTEE